MQNSRHLCTATAGVASNYGKHRQIDIIQQFREHPCRENASAADFYTYGSYQGRIVVRCVSLNSWAIPIGPAVPVSAR